jgi:glycosyltransferase involved in cell wall biosynthesis
MARHIAAATCCVFPSHAEALPMSWLEAMACGKAVLGYDVGWGPEVIEHGVSGLLSPENDIGALAAAMARLLDDAELRARLGEGGRRRVEEKFSLDRLVAETLAWYEDVIERGQS